MADSATALANLDVDAAIARIAAGTLTKVIAEEYGVPKPTLRDRLVNHPGYADAIISQAESLVEQATAEIMSEDLLPDAGVIARARVRLEAAHKWAAARDPKRWAPRPGDGGSMVKINISVGIPTDTAPQHTAAQHEAIEGSASK